MKTGWWRVTDQRLLKDLSKTLHQRGIREKSLQKNILKFNDYTQHLFTKKEYRCKFFFVFHLTYCWHHLYFHRYFYKDFIFSIVIFYDLFTGLRL